MMIEALNSSLEILKRNDLIKKIKIKEKKGWTGSNE